jgi:hypothetical protein
MPIPVIRDGMSLQDLTRSCRELAEEVRRIGERTKDNTEGWAGNQSNVTADRSYNANATTTDELADVLGTLISDLLEIGTLK